MDEKPRPNITNIIVTALLSIITVILTTTGTRIVSQIDNLDKRIREHEQLPFHPGTSVLINQLRETQSDLKEDVKEVKKDLKEILRTVK